MPVGQAERSNLRPYWTSYSAKDIPNWKITVVGGVKVVTQITLCEEYESDEGSYGTRCTKQYRVITQAVNYDANGIARSLGGISWELHREQTQGDGTKSFGRVDGGEIRGPKQIPIRVVYGGAKTGILTSKPHLLQLANTNIQETQIESDYATIMHKCNVPTPVFVGRNLAQQGETITMGTGIDIPVGGSATMLEPTGAALNATRLRLEDLRAQMRRQGAFMHEATNAMTAEEAALYARQRNARLTKAGRSLQDAAEGAMQDFVSFLPRETVPAGSIRVELDFGMKFDTTFVALCITAYEKGVLPREEALTALATGKLSEDFDAEEIALRMAAQDEEQRQLLDQQGANDPQDPNDPTATDKSKPQDPAPKEKAGAPSSEYDA